MIAYDERFWVGLTKSSQTLLQDCLILQEDLISLGHLLADWQMKFKLCIQMSLYESDSIRISITNGYSYGFGAQLIGPIQLHVKMQNSSICKFFQDIAWTFFCL